MSGQSQRGKKAGKGGAAGAAGGGTSGVTLLVKAVPGASRDEVAGWLGERLKIRVRQPAEDGRANRAILELLAGGLGVDVGRLEIVSGATNPEKRVLVRGCSEADVLRVWPRR